ncbi:MAG TPA: hypothetical protein VJ140_09310, partial [Actinomycetota bacterium]|nr:hypothetical protein [Actinomycetota bacterium]
VAHVPGPYVLAGHSNGGLFTLLYASTYPRQVAGLVLIDAVHIWTSERQTRMALRRSAVRPMPLVVIARGHPDPDTPYVEFEEPFWRQLQREPARLVPGGRLVVATESGHDIQHEQPELVLDALRDVVLAVRAGDLVPH